MKSLCLAAVEGASILAVSPARYVWLLGYLVPQVFSSIFCSDQPLPLRLAARILQRLIYILWASKHSLGHRVHHETLSNT
ncbi:hypothetical protein F2Q68_00007856 [Brassica cretica]|uniref:Uncharacterized protein n=1 Tax=Brassica cretica TaxID=69181 RepID=A0A8S9KZS7_BRACR|nr:hypothetical protein F2Q68_00007856 [Brassica cretica]